MAKIIVSIVSEQTIPNYLFIKELQDNIDLFLFISTKEMEEKNKTKIIYQTAKINKENVRKILINEDELFLVKNKLDKLGWQNSNNEYFVNITGGTKLMSIAVKEYFKNYESRFFYVPIGKNIYKEVFDNKEAISINIKTKLTINEYFNLQGVKVKHQPVEINKNESFIIFEKFQKNGFYIDAFPKNYTNSILTTKKTKENIPGFWFENFVYHLLKTKYNIDDSQIAFQLKLYDYNENKIDLSNFDNEIDIAYILNNSLYIIEAKVSIGKKSPKVDLITNIFYKISSINKQFGLRAYSQLITLSNFSKLHKKTRENIKRRSYLSSIKEPVCRNMILEIYNNIK